MNEVRQAHLPGNYELYDESSDALGPPICKFCWEKEGSMNSAALDTVWLTVDGWNVVWWLCRGHHQGVRSDDSMHVVKSESKMIRSPAMGT